MKKTILILFFITTRIFPAAAQWCNPENNLLTNFEGITDTIMIDTSLTENIWQIGSPHKTYFQSANSGTKAIVTDTVNVYPTNNYSTFMFKRKELNNTMERTFLTFTHKYDTDTLADGGYVEVSYDSINWVNVIQDTLPLDGICTNNFYSGAISNGEKAFSGKSPGWVTSYIHWIWHWGVFKSYNPPDSMFIRFVFISDSIQTGKEGWIIDDINFGDVSYGGINDNNEFFISSKVFPNPVTDASILQIENPMNKKIEVDIFDIYGRKLKNNLQMPNNRFEINRNEFIAGIYFCKISVNGKYMNSDKFIVE